MFPGAWTARRQFGVSSHLHVHDLLQLDVPGMVAMVNMTSTCCLLPPFRDGVPEREVGGRDRGIVVFDDWDLTTAVYAVSKTFSVFCG